MVTKANDHNRLDRFRKQRGFRWWHFVLLLIIGGVAWFASTIFIAYQRVETPNVAANGAPARSVQQLAQSSQPYNILLIGIGGGNHPGADLADTIMVASVDAKDQTVSLLSVPRDLYVTTPSGFKDKINAVDVYGDAYKPGYGPVWLKQTVSDTLGIPIDAFVRVDFDGFRKLVDTIGGVTIDVKTPLSDPLYPNDATKGYAPFYVSAGVHKMNGDTALKYARSRETTSDFDRARRQQEILSAIKDKALTPEVLANPKKLTDIITIIGQHMLTDLSTRDITDLLMVAKNMSNPTINHQVIDDSEGGLLVSSRAANGAFILVPKGGNFDQVKLFARSYIAAPAIKAEHPTITLQAANGVTKSTIDKVTQQLQTAGFTVTSATTATTPSPDTISVTTLIDTTNGKKVNSLAFLKDAYNLTPSKQSGVTDSSDFVLVLDTDFQTMLKGTASSNKTSQSKTKSTTSSRATTTQTTPKSTSQQTSYQTEVKTTHSGAPTISD